MPLIAITIILTLLFLALMIIVLTTLTLKSSNPNRVLGHQPLGSVNMSPPSFPSSFHYTSEDSKPTSSRISVDESMLDSDSKQLFIKDLEEMLNCPVSIEHNHKVSILLSSGQTISEPAYLGILEVSPNQNQIDCPITRESCPVSENSRNEPVNRALRWLNKRDNQSLSSLYNQFKVELEYNTRLPESNIYHGKRNFLLRDLCQVLNEFRLNNPQAFLNSTNQPVLANRSQA